MHRIPKWLKDCFEIAAVFVAIGLLIVNICQSRATERATEIAAETLQHSTEQFRIDERAWVTIEPIKPVLLTPEDVTFPAAFTCDIYPKNVGKTVATDIAVKAEASGSGEEFGRNSEYMSNLQDKYLLGQFKETGTNKPVIVASNPVPKVLAPGSVSAAPFRLTCQAPKIYPNGTQVLSYMVGRIDYCDQFGIRHWTKFCAYVVNRRGEVWNCQEGNDADRNPENPDDKATACHKP